MAAKPVTQNDLQFQNQTLCDETYLLFCIIKQIYFIITVFKNMYLFTACNSCEWMGEGEYL